MGDQPHATVRVLLADDDIAFGVVMKRFLESDGHACDHVPDAPSAIAALEKTSYDLLIADIGMPGNSRLELVQALTAMPDRPPIILMTGSPSLETATKSVGLAVFAYVTKPFDRTELSRLIIDASANGRVRRAVLESERRIRAWSEDIGHVRELLRRAPDTPAGVQSYLALTLGNLIVALGDLAEVTDVIARSDPHKKRVESVTLTKALQETIGVLENTRHLFKSKELGALRKKLEELLR
jgi:CheY-like chemotaxis protein